MYRIYKICLQSVIVIITCSALSQLIPGHTEPFMDRPWSPTPSKTLRQGKGSRINTADVNHRSEQTEPPPRRDCVCSKIYDPVCASNNESYFNLCFLECKVPRSENISVVHQGNCIPF
ncbi:uncharacterized protein LOC111364826 isoform X2 [Spodoptera litura]|uniref:Uncharacterized protein LOC111364826 isoform X2 n=1 Tax=Spodoptera litura TaxID=69820 RepID=A0A9J7ESY9_SPOLT|nr:uncharacterized protein LOC111364826 isoform X2 [Spodoptera litura]